MTDENEMAHVRSLPSDYVDVQDQSYDPNYISDISKKMQVPERICVDDGSGAAENTGYFDPGSGRQFSAMNVPDRIIVAGDNQHIGVREGLRKSPMELAFPSGTQTTMVELTTPPHVLTLEQSFPAVQEESEVKVKEGEGPPHDRQMVANGHLAAPAPYTPGLSPHDSLLVNEEDEATLLRTQVAKLTRRVTAIEQDSQRRAQREMGLYVALFGYVIWKVVLSFFRRGI
ncbi:mitochondrial fission factor-like [Babylonia areolata]|uniref:mitochondrial fission factor-like n=1 Tax=Babylonia areolata TaxID=304850 RepID=UPI003FD33E08